MSKMGYTAIRRDEWSLEGSLPYESLPSRYEKCKVRVHATIFLVDSQPKRDPQYDVM